MKKVYRRYCRQKHSRIWGSPDAVKFKPRRFQEGQIVPPRASLDGVAVEIQQAILHQLPYSPALQALISAPPSYFSACQSQRQSILPDILLQDVQPDMVFDVLTIVDPLLQLCAVNAPSHRSWSKTFYITFVIWKCVEFAERFIATSCSLLLPRNGILPNWTSCANLVDHADYIVRRKIHRRKQSLRSRA